MSELAEPESASEQRANPRRLATERRLRGILERDFSANRLVATKDDKINRSHYAREMGVASATILRYSYVFEEYEKRADIKTGPLKRLAEMREWLSTEYSARRLSLRDGKVDRQAFTEHFRLRGGTFMTRHPEIRKLIEDFDARAQKENYVPHSFAQSVERLTNALAGRPPLNSDRQTINLEEVSRRTDVPVSRLGLWPYIQQITRRQNEVLEAVKASKIDPFVHDRVFAFSDLAAFYPRAFLEKVASRFKQIISGRAKSGAKHPYLSLIGLLEWVGVSSNQNCVSFRRQLTEQGEAESESDWEEAVFAYRAHLVLSIAEGRAEKTTVDSTLTAIRVMLEGLNAAGVLPGLSVPLPGIKLAHRSGRKRQSVAEVVRTESDGRGQIDYLAFAKARLAEAREHAGLEVSPADDNDFLQVLATELSADKRLPADITAAIKLVLRRRLDALRVRAEEIVGTAQRELQRGGVLLSGSEIDAAAFEAEYFAGALNNYQRALLVRANFPLSDRSNNKGSPVALSNLLRLIEAKHGRIPPTKSQCTHQSLGQFYSKRYLELGGLDSISQLLIPSSETVGAILTLYLIESGSNISVGRTLWADCVEPSDREGHRRITGHKARANGKPIITDLPADSSAIRSIEWLVSASHALRLRTGPDSDRLFVAHVQGRVQLITPHWYTHFFSRLVQSIDELRGIRLLPSMIRPSVLLEAALSNDGRLKVGLAIGQHTEAVSQGYQQKWPTRLLYDQNIRRFSAAFENLILSSIDDVAKARGVSADTLKSRLSGLTATGLGPLCSGNGSRDGANGQQCSLDCWNDCPQLVLVAEVGSIALLQLWQEALLAAQPTWERDRPERWDEVWLPWLCFTQVVQEKMVRGPFIKVWQAAKLRANEIASMPAYVPPRPF